VSTFVAWASAFALTQLVEVPIYSLFLRAFLPERPFLSRIGIAFGASAITHPFVWFVFPLMHARYAVYLAVSELFAVVVEAAWLRLTGVRRPVPVLLLASLVANGASAGLGLSARALFGWP
jgi:hypothetical protein